MHDDFPLYLYMYVYILPPTPSLCSFCKHHTRSIHIRLWAAVCSKPSRPQGSLDLTEAKQCGAVKWRCNQNRPGTNPKLFERKYSSCSFTTRKPTYFGFSGFCKTLEFESLYFKILKWSLEFRFRFKSNRIKPYIKRDSSFPHLHDRTFMGHYH